MVKHLKRFWKDPVGSGLIVAAIIALVPSITSFFMNIPIVDILTSNISVSYWIVLLVFALAIYIVIYLISQCRKTKSTKAVIPPGVYTSPPEYLYDQEYEKFKKHRFFAHFVDLVKNRGKAGFHLPDDVKEYFDVEEIAQVRMGGYIFPGKGDYFRKRFIKESVDGANS